MNSSFLLLCVVFFASFLMGAHAEVPLQNTALKVAFFRVNDLSDSSICSTTETIQTYTESILNYFKLLLGNSITLPSENIFVSDCITCDSTCYESTDTDFMNQITSETTGDYNIKIILTSSGGNRVAYSSLGSLSTFTGYTSQPIIFPYISIPSTLSEKNSQESLLLYHISKTLGLGNASKSTSTTNTFEFTQTSSQDDYATLMGSSTNGWLSIPTVSQYVNTISEKTLSSHWIKTVENGSSQKYRILAWDHPYSRTFLGESQSTQNEEDSIDSILFKNHVLSLNIPISQTTMYSNLDSSISEASILLEYRYNLDKSIVGGVGNQGLRIVSGIINKEGYNDNESILLNAHIDDMNSWIDSSIPYGATWYAKECDLGTLYIKVINIHNVNTPITSSMLTEERQTINSIPYIDIEITYIPSTPFTPTHLPVPSLTDFYFSPTLSECTINQDDATLTCSYITYDTFLISFIPTETFGVPRIYFNNNESPLIGIYGVNSFPGNAITSFTVGFGNEGYGKFTCTITSGTPIRDVNGGSIIQRVLNGNLQYKYGSNDNAVTIDGVSYSLVTSSDNPMDFWLHIATGTTGTNVIAGTEKIALMDQYGGVTNANQKATYTYDDVQADFVLFCTGSGTNGLALGLSDNKPQGLYIGTITDIRVSDNVNLNHIYIDRPIWRATSHLAFEVTSASTVVITPASIPSGKYTIPSLLIAQNLAANTWLTYPIDKLVSGDYFFVDFKGLIPSSLLMYLHTDSGIKTIDLNLLGGRTDVSLKITYEQLIALGTFGSVSRFSFSDTVILHAIRPIYSTNYYTAKSVTKPATMATTVYNLGNGGNNANSMRFKLTSGTTTIPETYTFTSFTSAVDGTSFEFSTIDTSYSLSYDISNVHYEFETYTIDNGIVDISPLQTDNVSSWSITPEPQGFSFDTTTGVLSGSPTITGSFTYTITASSAYSTKDLSVTLIFPEGRCEAIDNWPSTDIGVTTTLSCESGYKGIAKRTCLAGGIWSDVDSSLCVSLSNIETIATYLSLDNMQAGGHKVTTSWRMNTNESWTVAGWFRMYKANSDTRATIFALTDGTQYTRNGFRILETRHINSDDSYDTLHLDAWGSSVDTNGLTSGICTQIADNTWRYLIFRYTHSETNSQKKIEVIFDNTVCLTYTNSLLANWATTPDKNYMSIGSIENNLSPRTIHSTLAFKDLEYYPGVALSTEYFDIIKSEKPEDIAVGIKSVSHATDSIKVDVIPNSVPETLTNVQFGCMAIEENTEIPSVDTVASSNSITEYTLHSISTITIPITDITKNYYVVCAGKSDSISTINEIMLLNKVLIHANSELLISDSTVSSSLISFDKNHFWLPMREDISDFSISFILLTTKATATLLSYTDGAYLTTVGSKFLYISSGYLRFIAKHSSNAEIVSNVVVNNDVWHSIVLTYSMATKTYSLYIDQELQGSTQLDDSYTISTLEEAYMVYYYSGTYGDFQGSLKNVIFHHSTLSIEEIAAADSQKPLELGLSASTTTTVDSITYNYRILKLAITTPIDVYIYSALATDDVPSIETIKINGQHVSVLVDVDQSTTFNNLISDTAYKVYLYAEKDTIFAVSQDSIEALAKVAATLSTSQCQQFIATQGCSP
ncbi:hypothetical protein WA158_005986, partial [Blastocystis sp. Blastoise]